MVIFFILTLTSFSSIASPSQGRDLPRGNSIVSRALTEIKRNNVAEGYNILVEVDSDSPEFISALMELQKIHYKNEQWDRFFAYAEFYKKRFLSDEKNWKNYFQPRFFSLEVLALGRHCLWEEGQLVAEQGLFISQKISFQYDKRGNEIEHAVLFFPSVKKFKGIIQRSKKKTLRSSFFSKTHLWPVQKNTIFSISHPRVLRFKLRNGCI